MEKCKKHGVVHKNGGYPSCPPFKEPLDRNPDGIALYPTGARPEPTLRDWEERLRKDFQEFADSIVWSNDDGSEKYIGVGNMADWLVEKIKARDAALLEYIEGQKLLEPEDGEMADTAQCYNAALDRVTSYIRNVRS